ncbi:hypothetical protein [Hydrogenivirga sp. 128-5-R1-1]|uniref:hypothetical protein n=1 Tax=Hydrogenivirga sp. 128-5-R1-1 TaxID=392423 RepID=UPI00015F1860|nr:hypothetical protein [Hydrogenivirga sp. 128-5-R1-1]EDP75388.1 hypothetical protein HG1285_15526 [Hydrogenivirga sp. 128-5-R1-1]
MKFFGRKKEEERVNNPSDGEKKKLSKEQEEAGKAFMKAILGDMADMIYEEEQPQEQPQAQAQETQEVKEVKGEEEKKEELPKDRDEVLIEILKELKALNSNVKAVIVRMDAEREENRQFREQVIDLLGEQVAKPF